MPPLVVLIVEDHEDSRALFALVLQGAGYTVREAGTIAEARASIAEAMPDVLLADFTLPDGQGSLLRDLVPSALRIMISGFSQDEMPPSGFDVVMQKPINFDRLLGVIRERAPGST